eukprot:11053257-Heterocapsa_arctica.AAC.1
MSSDEQLLGLALQRLLRRRTLWRRGPGDSDRRNEPHCGLLGRHCPGLGRRPPEKAGPPRGALPLALRPGPLPLRPRL